MVDWMIIHEPGNPQTRITSFAPEGKTTLAATEGRIRQIFYELNLRGRDCTWRDILTEVKKDEHGIPKSFKIPMAERVKQWLFEQGIKVWQ